MTASLKLDSKQMKQTKQVIRFFRKSAKVRYNKKLTGRTRLYISEKNSLRSMNGVLSLYEERLN